MECVRIQQQGQVQPRRTLLAHGKGSTAKSRDVLDTRKIAASPQKLPVTSPLTSTSQKIKGNEEDDTIQSLELKQGGSGGIGGVGCLA